MTVRRYYSQRKGSQAGGIDRNILEKAFKALYFILDKESYFQEALGYHCVDQGWVAGTLGEDPESYVYLQLRKEDLFPLSNEVEDYEEEDLFDLIEFFYDHISKPLNREYHSYNDCGWHASEFDKKQGQLRYEEEVNRLLADYRDGYVLTAAGEVEHLPDSGMAGLFERPAHPLDPANVEDRIEDAQRRFLSRHSSLNERKSAVRELADVLEILRPQVKTLLMSTDERALFNMANSFGIRHHNAVQKTKYDGETWFEWMFYIYLATLRTVSRILGRDEGSHLGRGEQKRR